MGAKNIRISITSALNAAGIEATKQQVDEMSRSVAKSMAGAATANKRHWADIKAAWDMGCAAIRKAWQFASAGLKSAFKFETQTTQFKTLIGNIDEARAHMADLKALFAAKPASEKPVDHAPVAKLDPLCDDRGCTVDYESLILRKHGDWEPGTPTGLRGRPNHMLLGSHVGDELLLPFKGSEIGAVFVWDEKPATLACTVDGGAAKTVAPRPAKPGKPYLDTTPLFEGLDPAKEHELRIRIAGEGKVGLTCLLLNGEIAKVDFGAKGTLPGIDAIYKTMKPIAYEPPADRFALLPKTMKTLREGGTLRMVLLGDSIIGNLSSSSFELLMMRDHPNAKVEKIVSIRGGTGCNWYCKENRVKKYVLDLKPDLLVIGGISNGEDPECVRSVVRQVRAALPDLEILITTPVFGALSEQRIAWFDADIEKTKGSFRHGLKGVAADEKCAFFDMTGPWWQYLSTSGKAPGYFMGDAVHANVRGSQLIGRLFARWFQD